MHNRTLIILLSLTCAFLAGRAFPVGHAGSALGASSDAANMFKSSLARGEIRIIGATTITEYKEYIGEDEEHTFTEEAIAASQNLQTAIANEWLVRIAKKAEA